MRYAIAVLVLLALCVVFAHAAEHSYTVQCCPTGTEQWVPAPNEFIYNPGPWPLPPWHVEEFSNRRDAQLAANTGSMNHPDYDWRVYAP